MNETQIPRREIVDDPDGTVTEYSDFESTEAASGQGLVFGIYGLLLAAELTAAGI
jgi:hypothetical protein